MLSGQLGLKLDDAKGPTQVLVVDRMEKPAEPKASVIAAIGSTG
jgi:uncharacterized protein (TIGR03435 family)